MAVIPEDEPIGGREIIHAALRQRIRDDHPLPILRRHTKTGSALPVYHIAARGCLIVDPVAHARKIGWRYPVINEGDFGLAFLLRKSDHLEFVGTTVGSFASRLCEAAIFAENEVRDNPRKFHPRLLEVPALHLYALWIFAPRYDSRFLIFSMNTDPLKWTSRSDMNFLINTVAEKNRLAGNVKKNNQ